MKVVGAHMPEQPKGRTIVVGAGKASASMAAAVEAHWEGPLEGIIITCYSHGCATKHIRVVEAAHPVPDATGMSATRELTDLVLSTGPDDLVLFLFSGGGSSLLNATSGGISFQEKQFVYEALLKSGVSVSEMNSVRKHLSDVKGGNLAALAHPARCVTLMVSDVPGDDPGKIASGPSVPDKSTREEAQAALDRYRLDVPSSVRRHLQKRECETPKLGDSIFKGNLKVIIATPQNAFGSSGGQSSGPWHHALHSQ